MNVIERTPDNFDESIPDNVTALVEVAVSAGDNSPGYVLGYAGKWVKDQYAETHRVLQGTLEGLRFARPVIG